MPWADRSLVYVCDTELEICVSLQNSLHVVIYVSYRLNDKIYSYMYWLTDLLNSMLIKDSYSISTVKPL